MLWNLHVNIKNIKIYKTIKGVIDGDIFIINSFNRGYWNSYVYYSQIN